MKEEDKLHIFVYTMDNEIYLQRKKTRIGDCSEIDMYVRVYE